MYKLPILASALLLSVSVSVQATPADDAIADAKISMKKVNKVGYLWRDTGKILKKAEAAANKGDNDKAVKLARQAEEQAKDAYAQYDRYYKDAGPRF